MMYCAMYVYTNLHITHLLSLTVRVTAVVNKARIVSLASGVQDLRGNVQLISK